jgi:hypothetical protein
MGKKLRRGALKIESRWGYKKETKLDVSLRDKVVWTIVKPRPHDTRHTTPHHTTPHHTTPHETCP